MAKGGYGIEDEDTWQAEASTAKGVWKSKEAKELSVKFQWKRTYQNYVSIAFIDHVYKYGQFLSPELSDN